MMDELEIQHGLSSRKESPTFETTVRLAIESSFKDLFQSKNLYQNLSLDLSSFESELEKEGIELDEGALEKFFLEAKLRPWKVLTHHQGDDDLAAEISRVASAGCDPIGIPRNEISLYFYAPSIQIQCGTCKETTVFEALRAGTRTVFDSPYPKTVNGCTEQAILFYYRCVGCRKHLHSILALRNGLNIQLCGYAPRRSSSIKLNIPKKLMQIADDSRCAVQEGDLCAGFYHARTLLEHYMKNRLDMDLAEKIRGEELVVNYQNKLPKSLKNSIPSLKPLYEELSQFMHSRTGSMEDFQRIMTKIEDHITAIRLLEKYNNFSS